MKAMRLLIGSLLVFALAAPAQLSNIPVQVTRGGNADGGVALSPDGKFLAYTIDENEKPIRLLLRELSTSNTRQLDIPGKNAPRRFVFSPDGKLLYFARPRP